MRSTLLVLVASIALFSVNVEAQAASTAWVTFDDTTCQILKNNGASASFSMTKAEDGVCVVKPASETYRNAGIIVLEKNQAPKVIALPGISNLSDAVPLPKPVVPSGSKRTLVVLY